MAETFDNIMVCPSAAATQIDYRLLYPGEANEEGLSAIIPIVVYENKELFTKHFSPNLEEDLQNTQRYNV